MKALGALVLVGSLAGLSGCISTYTVPPAACPAGQEAHRTAQLFFGRNIGDQPGVSQADFQGFVDKEITPRFPDGLTVLDGGGQWRGAENVLIREASKVVMIVLPRDRDVSGRIEAVRSAYKQRFHQEFPGAADHPGLLRSRSGGLTDLAYAVGPLDMARQFVRVEIDPPEIAAGVAPGLVVEVLDLGVAARPPALTARALTWLPNSTTATKLLPLEP